MAGRSIKIIAGAVMLTMCMVAWGQQKQQVATEASKVKPKKAAFIPPVYLGAGNFSGGTISYTNFEHLMKEGVFSRDSAGNTYNVVGFDFIYGELGAFEDSAGEQIFVTDYQRSRCKGNKLSGDIIDANLFGRVKRGDTVVIQSVMLTRNNNNARQDTFLGKTVNCYITK